MTHLLSLGASVLFSWSVGLSWLLNFIETRDVYLWHLQHRNYIEITWSVMPKPVFLMTVQRLTRSTTPWLIKYGPSMSNETQASMGQLTPQHSKLKPVNWQIYLLVWANFARNWTCHLQRNYRPSVFKHWRCFSVLNYRQAVWLGYGGCSFVCRYVRITWLLSTH